MPPHGGGGRGGCSAPPPGGREGGRDGCSAQSPGGRGGGRGGASAAFEVPIFRRDQAVHFKAPNSRRGRARKSCRGRSGPGPSKGRPQSPPCQYHVAEQTPVSCSSKLLGTWKESSTTTTSSSTPQALLPDTTEISTSPGRCLSSSPCSTIFFHQHPDWYMKFYIRMDRSEHFHIYPDVAGPFKSLQEGEKAIDCHLRGREHEMMRKESLDKLSPMDWLVRRALYWPDGKRRKCSEAFSSENTCTEKDPLLLALVGMYNDDHELFGDRAYELKDALHYQTLREGKTHIWYNHLNFTAKTKEAGSIDDLFFAEVMHTKGKKLAVSSFCKINTDDNGCCYGCTNNGSVGMKHPNKANAYRADGCLQLGYSGGWDASDEDVEDVKDEEDRIRRAFKGLDDPDNMKYTRPPHEN